MSPIEAELIGSICGEAEGLELCHQLEQGQADLRADVADQEEQDSMIGEQVSAGPVVTPGCMGPFFGQAVEQSSV